MNTKSKKRLLVLLSTVGVLAVAVAAYAYWSAGGAGTANATTAGGNASLVNAVTTSSLSGLYPGGSVTLSGEFDNTGNQNAVHVNSLSVAISSVTPAPTKTCAAANYSITTQPTVSTADVAAATQGGAFTGGALTMDETNANQDGCKGATVNLTYTVG
jgi:hypothetical protein